MSNEAPKTPKMFAQAAVWCILTSILCGLVLIAERHKENREKVIQARAEYNEVSAMLDENDHRLERIRQRLESLEREFNIDPAKQVTPDGNP